MRRFPSRAFAIHFHHHYTLTGEMRKIKNFSGRIIGLPSEILTPISQEYKCATSLR
jgi:hypothetical protein